MTFPHLLLSTIWLRPYVFIFLGVYLLLATWHLGLGRALAFLVLGYLVSWAAELCSITWGFPFGEYLYIPATRGQELWVAGVPFMDSLSYVFLAYASYTLALAALAPRSRRSRFRLEEADSLQRGPGPWILGAVLMVTLDIIIDPLALRGYRWFLGQIYGYPEPGVYFGIPLANFGGWLLVSLVLIRILQYLAARLPAFSWRDRGRRRFAYQGLLGPLFYLGILGFNLAMTFWIGEACLGWVGIFIYLPFFTWLAVKLASRQ
ncbi:MAG: carotenoid biosynthesis protein [Deltaproteobacteria bacterium]|nr:carotenoid biosynthesis protein [Deltaproteobacteria bacterium]